MNLVHRQDAREGRSIIVRAFTLVECLVVVAIIGILMGLLLPAVQAARESARRAQCAANLNQLGLGIHNYLSVHNVFPTAILCTYMGGTNVQMNGFSELAFILPHLDQGPLYDAINFDFAYEESAETPFLENHTARNTTVGLFLCPSDGGPNLWNSYRFNRGRRNYETNFYDGPFGFMPNPATITDGLSRTAFVSERVGGNFVQGTADRVRNVKYPGSFPPDRFPSNEQFISYCLDYEPGRWEATSGRYWLFSGFMYGHYNHRGSPNDLRPTCEHGTLRDVLDGGLCPPRSFHPGLVNVLFGDGHVRAITDGVDPQAWAAMGTKKAGD